MGKSSVGEAAARAVSVVRGVHSSNLTSGGPTGLETLDSMLGGLNRKNLVVIASRPSLGKTSLAMQFCHEASKRGEKVLFVSPDMPSDELALRLVCGAAGVDNVHVRGGALSDDEVSRMSKAAESLGGVPLDIIDDEYPSIQRIWRAVDSYDRTTGPYHLVCVDGLLSVSPDVDAPRAEQIASVMQGLKRIALTRNIPVLVTTQLSREAEAALPDLTHLRESSAIEEIADIVIAIHRDKSTNLFVLKNRHGVCGAVSVKWVPEATRFEEA